jgi:hypothetical protein
MEMMQRQTQSNSQRRMSFLKMLFWAYFLLLIFEGALRKWILPQLSAPLLLVRDPVALLIVWEAYRTNKWPKKWSTVAGILAVGMLGLCVIQTVAGDNPLASALYGLRSYLLPFPVAFIMGENLDASELRRFGVCALWLLLPLTALEVAQYLAPPGSFLNSGAYAGAEQIAYVGTRSRASGTFSFVTGPTNYGPLAAAFIFYGLADEKFAKKWLLWAATFALILSVPVIGSRTLVFELAGVVVCAAIASLCGVSQFVKTLRVIVPLLAVSALVSLLPVFSEASNSLNQRFAEASELEGGVGHAVQTRTYGNIAEMILRTDFGGHVFGIGMGRGAAAVSRLATGRASFVAGEDEFARELNEFGPVPGLAFGIFRICFVIVIAASAIKRARDQEPLALLLVPLLVPTLLLGVLEQPTVQGFMVIGLAFSLAALRQTRLIAQPVPIRRVLPHPVRFSSPGR